MKETTIAMSSGEDRVAVHERQISYAREAAREVGGKFVTDRGTDCWGHPVIAVIDAKGARVEEVRQDR